MNLKILVTAGDGIGPEVTNEAVAVLREVATLGGHTFDFESKRIGGVAIVQDGTPLPAETLAAALNSDAVLLGAVGGNEFNSLAPDKRPEAGLLQIRSALGGFANLRPAFAFKELTVNSPLRPEVVEGADILFVRELLGGLYFGLPRGWNRATNDGGNEAWNTMRYTKAEVVRVARIAFQLATKRRNKVTSVDKANVLEVSQLCDEAAVITGSLGMLPSATIGGKVNLYEPVHGSAPDIAGKGLANPLGAILTGALILRHSAGLEAEAAAIETAVRKVLEQGFRTPDLARSNPQGFKVLSTTEMGAKVRETVKTMLVNA